MTAAITRTTSQQYARPYRPRAVAAANAAGRALERVGLRAPLDEASLIRAARKQTGLHFFADEAALREPMRRLLASVEEEARLHPLGRIMIRVALLRSVANRLRIDALFDHYAELRETPVERPVFIVGLQRTATTLLQRLLACHSELRALQSWEAMFPAPLRPSVPGVEDPRIGMARFAERAAKYMAPDFFAIHPIEGEGQEEDSLLFDACFMTTTSEALMNVPSFTRWLESSDHASAYQDYRRNLQLLLWQRPGRWLGKTPLHLEHIDELLKTFPDAKILHTHRDPASTVGSLCSMIAHGRGFFSDRVDSHEVGEQWLAKTARMVERGLEARAAAPTDRFLDVHYDDTVEDPIKQIRRICDFIDAPLDDDSERRMRVFLTTHPQHAFGKHRYTLEDFGLDADKISRSFSRYREHYGVSSE